MLDRGRLSPVTAATVSELDAGICRYTLWISETLIPHKASGHAFFPCRELICFFPLWWKNSEIPRFKQFLSYLALVLLYTFLFFFFFPWDFLLPLANHCAEQISQNIAYSKANRKGLQKFVFSSTAFLTPRKGFELMQEFIFLSCSHCSQGKYECWWMCWGKPTAEQMGRLRSQWNSAGESKDHSKASMCGSDQGLNRGLKDLWCLNLDLPCGWNIPSSSLRGRALFHGFGYSSQASITLSPCQIYNWGQLPVISGHSHFVCL